MCSVFTLTAQIWCDVIDRNIQITQNHRQLGHLLWPETKNKHREGKINAYYITSRLTETPETLRQTVLLAADVRRDWLAEVCQQFKHVLVGELVAILSVESGESSNLINRPRGVLKHGPEKETRRRWWQFSTRTREITVHTHSSCGVSNVPMERETLKPESTLLHENKTQKRWDYLDHDPDHVLHWMRLLNSTNKHLKQCEFISWDLSASHLAAHANGMRYWPNRPQAILAFFKTFWAA